MGSAVCRGASGSAISRGDSLMGPAVCRGASGINRVDR